MDPIERAKAIITAYLDRPFIRRIPVPSKRKTGNRGTSIPAGRVWVLAQESDLIDQVMYKLGDLHLDAGQRKTLILWLGGTLKAEWERQGAAALDSTSQMAAIRREIEKKRADKKSTEGSGDA